MSADVKAPEATSDFIGSGREGGLRDQLNGWWQRVRTGDMGMLPAIGGFIVLVILFSFLPTLINGDGQQNFFTARNMANLLTQSAPLIMLGAALVFVLLLGEIDLSAAVTYGVAMDTFVVLVQPNGANVAWPLALLIALAIGFGIGFIIGFFVARIGVPSFVVTLGLFLGLQGVELLIIGAAGNYNVQIPEILAIENSTLPDWAGWLVLVVALGLTLMTSLLARAQRTKAGVPKGSITLLWVKLAAILVLGGAAVLLLSANRGSAIHPISGLPVVVPIVLALLWIGTFVLDRTPFGRHLYATGGNQEAARRSGIKVTAVKWTAFIICSTLAVIAGLFAVSHQGSVDATLGKTDVLNGVAAAVVGGVSLFGGKGRLAQAAVGGLVITVITNGLGLIRSFPSGLNLLVTGGVLILAASVDALSRLRSGGKLRR